MWAGLSDPPRSPKGPGLRREGYATSNRPDVAAVVGGLSLGAAALQQPAKLPSVRDIQKVRDNLYFVSGGDTYDRSTWTGGNTVVFVTEKGVVLVDTMLAGAGRGILERVKSVTDKPVTTIINTHTHYDHSGSNTEFPATVEYVAHENTQGEHGEADLPARHQLRRVQGRQRQVPAEAHLQGPADALLGQGPDRPVSLRARPHQRRYLRRVPRRARHAHGRHVPARAHAVHRRGRQRRQRGRVQSDAAARGRRPSRTSTPSSAAIPRRR